MGSNDFEVKIKTLTPIWTGGVEGKCDRVHETGIIGSLRWWYEIIIRGLGGYACDPTGDKRCELSGKEKTDEERKNSMCPVCYLFGCGGWKRRFRLEVTNNGETVPFELATLDERDKFNYWWLSQIFEKAHSTKLPFGRVNLDFRQTRNDEEVRQLKALLSIMAHIGAIGAKTQYGFGQFDWDEKMTLKESVDTIEKFLKDNNFKHDLNNPRWYSLDKFWFYELLVPTNNGLFKKFQKANVIGNDKMPYDYLPVSFDIRYRLPNTTNQGLRDAYYSSLRKIKSKEDAKRETRSIFGTLEENDKIGSRIFVSHLFRRRKKDGNYTLRVWGFTNDSVAEIVGEKLKGMFGFEKVPQIKKGADIIKGLGGAQ